MEFSDDTTVGSARARLFELAREGHACPCCRQNVKIYKRPLNHVPAAAMVALYRECLIGWGHMPTIMANRLPALAGQGGYAVLGKHWGLIEEATAQRKDGGRAGWWRVTTIGARFVTGSLKVKKYAEIYNGRMIALMGEGISVHEALGKEFDLMEILDA